MMDPPQFVPNNVLYFVLMCCKGVPNDHEPEIVPQTPLVNIFIMIASTTITPSPSPKREHYRGRRYPILSAALGFWDKNDEGDAPNSAGPCGSSVGCPRMDCCSARRRRSFIIYRTV